MSEFQTRLTSKFLKDLLRIQQKEMTNSAAPDLDIHQIWSYVVGEKIAQVTQVKSLSQGILIIKVASASLAQLLSSTEKQKIIVKLKADYAYLKIKNVVFRTG